MYIYTYFSMYNAHPDFPDNFMVKKRIIFEVLR